MILKRHFFIWILLLTTVAAEVKAQNANLNPKAKTLTYEEIYDNPYDINKLFILLQPIYGEFSALNTTAGLGFEMQYYLKNILDFRGSARIPYAKGTDLVRKSAGENSTVDNEVKGYASYEISATYHIVDKEVDTETKFILYSKRYKGNKWAATVPLHTIIPTKVRRIYGVRGGGFFHKTGVYYNDVMNHQNVWITNREGTPIDADASIYGNLGVNGFFIGGSYAMIKNVAVQPDKIYGTLVSDLIFTTYLDLMYAPSINLSDIYDDGIIYYSDAIQKRGFGFRAGMDGKFNRKFGWGYGVEIGSRPGLKKGGFYILAKMSFPIIATQLRYQVESFGK